MATGPEAAETPVLRELGGALGVTSALWDTLEVALLQGDEVPR